MRDRLKEAFDSVRAEEELKSATRDFVLQKVRERQQRTGWSAPAYRGLVPALACFLLVAAAALGGWRLYFTPTSVISIDINPSIELEVNRFDRVISVRGWNDDGEALAAGLDVDFMEYTQAVEQVLATPIVTDCLARDEVLSIVVVGEDLEQRGRILEDMESCTSGCGNAYCWQAAPGEVEAAHEAGLSYGKYRAFLELQALDPSVTPEEVQDLTMREIRQWIQELSPGGSSWGEGGSGMGGMSGMGGGHGGNGHGHGAGQSRTLDP